jgi:hypothetical protein
MSDIQDTSYEIKVYKIWYDDEPENFYIGSTKYRQLAKRMGYHRGQVNLGKTSKLYTTIREKGINNFRYVQIASCMVNNFDEQRMFEQHYLELLKPTLNMIRAFATEEDKKADRQLYRQKPENKEKQKLYHQTPEIKEKQKAYNNRPEVKERIKESYRTPEYKEKKKKYRETPENKEKQKLYHQTPESREKQRLYRERPKHKEYQRAWYQKKKYEKIDKVFQKFKEHFNIP